MRRTTLSTDAAFTPLSFTPLHSPGTDSGTRQGYTRGHSAGYTAGLRAADAEAKSRLAQLEAEHAALLAHLQARTDHTLAALATAVTAVQQSTLPVLEDSQDVLLQAALELAEAVIGRELTDSAAAARAAVNRVLAQAGTAGPLTVRMNPADLAVLGEAGGLPDALRFQADPTLAQGDAVADFEHGFLDARIGTALQRARQALRDGQP
jgi:flagellar assembly protein FliH